MISIVQKREQKREMMGILCGNEVVSLPLRHGSPRLPSADLLTISRTK